MRRTTDVLIAAVTVTAVLASGCARSRGPRNTRDFPAAFVPIEWAAERPPSTSTNVPSREGCAIRLRDERDGTTLLLRRSENRQESSREGGATVTVYRAIGDYEVLTPGRYGLTAGEWLRVDCTTWRPVGPVPRSS
jgi:hypothetical protein